jgi:hypothetical protein
MGRESGKEGRLVFKASVERHKLQKAYSGATCVGTITVPVMEASNTVGSSIMLGETEIEIEIEIETETETGYLKCGIWMRYLKCSVWMRFFWEWYLSNEPICGTGKAEKNDVEQGKEVVFIQYVVKNERSCM